MWIPSNTLQYYVHVIWQMSRWFSSYLCFDSLPSCSRMWTRELDIAFPIQLVASQTYTPKEVGSSGLAVRAKTSPERTSLLSLNQRSVGVGTPTTLHSNDTVPCSVRRARSSSRNSGALYVFGTEKMTRKINQPCYFTLF